jgi:diguanylate cyclase (GGDEF)-like protein/PAS domain S-box-containing protein
MDYSKMKKAQLIEEIEALRRKIRALEGAEVERTRVEEALRQSEARLRGILSSLHETMIIVFDREGKHVSVWGTPELDKRYGIRSNEVVGRSLMDVFPLQEAKERLIRIQHIFKTGESWRDEYLLHFPGGDFWHDISFSPIQGPSGEVSAVVGFIRDITERKRAEEELAYLASHDALTGLPNRMLFNDRLKLALAQAHRNQQKLAVMLLDLDHLKDINDTLGHSVGDKLLQAVGERLMSLLRKSDTVARMGGDEFMLVLPETARVEDAARIASKVLQVVRMPFALDGHEIHITTSIGIAMYPDDGEDVDSLMRDADIAMYRAKAKGRDNYQRYSGKGRKRWTRERAVQQPFEKAQDKAQDTAS